MWSLFWLPCLQTPGSFCCMACEYILSGSCRFSPPCDPEVMLLCAKQWLDLNFFISKHISCRGKQQTCFCSRDKQRGECWDWAEMSCDDNMHHSKMQMWAVMLDMRSCFHPTDVRWTCLCLVSLMTFQTCQAISPKSKQGNCWISVRELH